MSEEFEESTVEVSHDDGGSADAGAESQVAAEEHGQQQQFHQESPQEYNWKAANEALSRMKEENARLQGQLMAMQSLGQQNQQRPTQQQKDFFDGREKDDYAQIGDLQTYVNSLLSEKERQFSESIEQIQLQAKDPSYKETIEKYRDYLSPTQKQLILQSPQPWTAAYEMVTSSAAYYRDQIAQQQSPAAQKIAANMQKPGSASALGATGTLSKAASWESMSDAEIIALGNDYARGGS